MEVAAHAEVSEAPGTSHDLHDTTKVKLSRWTAFSFNLDHFLPVWTFAKKLHKQRRILAGTHCDKSDDKEGGERNGLMADLKKLMNQKPVQDVCYEILCDDECHMYAHMNLGCASNTFRFYWVGKP